MSPPHESPPEPLAEPSIYNRVFWLAYAANVCLVTANALTFRFAELVDYLGGSEGVAGSIVGMGVVGAIAARLFLGQTIDRFGTRALWMLTSLLFIAGCSAFVSARELTWLLWAARMAFAVGLAGMFTCSMVHIQNHVPAARRTEIIGILGTSGFIGMIVGTQVGDLIFLRVEDLQVRFVMLFGGTALLGLAYLAIVYVLTYHDDHDKPEETPAVHKLIFRFWPGSVVLVAMMMGTSLTVTTVFLTRFATHQKLGGIGTFFAVYAISAFTFRVMSRRWSRSIGRSWMILFGLSGQCAGFSLIPFVGAQWHFIIPATCAGFGHAMLFPAVVSLGSGAFPKEYRGTGTTIVLGFTEVGAMISAPILGGIIDYFDRAGFLQMFWTAAGSALAVGCIYCLTGFRRPDEDLLHDEPSPGYARPPEQESVRIPFPQIGRNV